MRSRGKSPGSTAMWIAASVGNEVMVRELWPRAVVPRAVELAGVICRCAEVCWFVGRQVDILGFISLSFSAHAFGADARRSC